MEFSPNQPSQPSFDVLGVLSRRFGTVLFFMILALVLGLFYFFKAPKTFESEAKFYVDERQGPTMSSDDGSNDRPTNVEMYVEIFRSTSNIRNAIADGNLDSLPSLLTVEDPVKVISENLVATTTDPTGRSGVVRTTYRGSDAEETKTVLQALLTAFDQHIRESSKGKGNEVANTLNEFRSSIDANIKKLDESIVKMVKDPDLQLKDGVVLSTHQSQVSNLQEELDDVRRDVLRLEARLEQLETANQAGVVTDSMIVESLQQLNDGSLGGYVTTHQEYLRLKIREQEMLGTLGNDHPNMVALRKQLTMLEKMRMQELSALRTGNAGDQPLKLYDIVTSHLASRLELLKVEEKSLVAGLQKEQAAVSDMAAKIEQLAAMQRERQRLEQRNAALVLQLGEYNVLQNYDWRNMVVSDRPEQGTQVIPSLPISVLGSLLVGSVFGFLFIALQEIAEKSFRSPAEIASRFNVPVVAQFAEYRTRKLSKNRRFRKFNRDLLMIHDPSAVQAESFRALRTSIFFRARQEDAKVIQMTSPNPEDGKSSISANLAMTIAQAGRSVVLVDCDFRKPTQHRRFHCDNKLGMTSIIVEEAELADVLVDVGIPHFNLITSGPQFANPAEILTSHGFRHTIEMLREKFDFIIIDSPPVLPVSDPTIIANHADLIYLSIRIRKGVQINTEQSIKALTNVGAKLEGIVVNRIRPKDRFGEKGGRYGYYGRFGDAYTNKYENGEFTRPAVDPSVMSQS
ncbi:MAG: polysaccharide biosynthesis tyrosine autokinase [Planctomycetota bacterium]